MEKVTKKGLNTYDGTIDPLVLEKRIRLMEKIFDVVNVPNNKKNQSSGLLPCRGGKLMVGYNERKT